MFYCLCYCSCPRFPPFPPPSNSTMITFSINDRIITALGNLTSRNGYRFSVHCCQTTYRRRNDQHLLCSIEMAGIFLIFSFNAPNDYLRYYYFYSQLCEVNENLNSVLALKAILFLPVIKSRRRQECPTKPSLMTLGKITKGSWMPFPLNPGGASDSRFSTPGNWYWTQYQLVVARGVQPFGISAPHWKKKTCLGPYIKYMATCNHKKVS